jgi:hypothetical protein
LSPVEFHCLARVSRTLSLLLAPVETLMAGWRELRVDGLGPVERVVAVFQVGPPLARLPFPSFKVKVIERANGSFLACPNVVVRRTNGEADWIGGLGASVEEALEDALRRFVRNLGDRQELSEADFAWADPLEF